MAFLRKLFIYALGTGFSKLITFLVIPLYTNYISAKDYGQADLVYSAVGIIVSFTFMEIWTGLMRFEFDNNDETYKKKIYTNCQVICVMLVPVFLLIQISVSMIIEATFVWLSCVYGFIYLESQILQRQVRVDGREKAFVFSGIINSIAQFVVAFVMLVVMKKGVSTVIIAPLVGHLLQVLYIEISGKYIKYFDKVYIDKKICKNLIKFSIPLSINSVAFWSMDNINKYFAAYFLGYEASGYISVASKCAMVVTVAVSIYALVWQESAFANATREDRDKYYSKMWNIYIVLLTALTTGVLIGMYIIFPIFIGKDYDEAKTILYSYFIAVFISGINSFLGQLYGAEKKTKWLMYSTVAGMMANCIMVIVFIKHFGITIIPIGSAIGFSVSAILRYININRFITVRTDLRNCFKCILSIAIVVFMINKSLDRMVIYIFTLMIWVFITVLFNRKYIKEFIDMIKNRKGKVL